MKEAQIKEEVRKALSPIFHRVQHPEAYDNLGNKLRKYEKPYFKPMEPRHRLSTNLVLLLALKEVEIALMKEIMADTEAVEDAKKHKEAQCPSTP